MQIPPTIRIGGSLTKSQYQYTMQTPDTEKLYALAPKVEAALRQSPLLQDVTSDLQVKNPQLTVDVDRDKAYALGVSPDQVANSFVLGVRHSARPASSTRPTTSTTSSLELLPQYQNNPTELSKLYVHSSYRQIGSARYRRETRTVTRPAYRESLRPIARRSPSSFNLKPGRRAGRCHQVRRGCRSARSCRPT